MNKGFWCLGVAAGLALATPALADAPASAAAAAESAADTGRAGKAFSRADTDGDGKASWAEVQAALPKMTKERFDRLDTDDDGALTRKELRAGAAKTGEKGPKPKKKAEAAAADAPGAKYRERLIAADTDNDEKVTRAEFAAAFPKARDDAFARLDRSGDGNISRDDRPDAGTGGGSPADRSAAREQLIARSDANADGKVSFEELTAARPGFPEATFQQLDQNKDGVLDAAESGAAAAAAPALRPAAGAAGAGNRAAALREADTDQDGRLSREEAKALPNMTDERFAARDCNGNGYLERDECPRDVTKTGEPQS